MEVELLALENNKTWEISDLTKNHNNVKCKWVHIVKYKPNDERDQYKARLLANEYTQSYGMDNFHTCTLVEKINSIKIIISLANHKG